MTAVVLNLQDLDGLEQLAPDLCFGDSERREALLENGTRDFNAVPGSGKTSLLAAKLLLLAKKWPHTHKGICILSHTNVAREEITHRLAKSVEGSRLLAYPHFIGTIHGFVNQFLAMAMLRKLEIKVDVIDDTVFAKRAMSLVMNNQYFTLRAWLKRQPNAEALLTGLYYKNHRLEVQSEGGKLPGADSTSYKQLLTLKNTLADEGVFRYRDMFAYAELALVEQPHLLDIIHQRFPMIFIDEMQDTSWEQEDILNRLFDDKSVVQRFGDVDQKIISGDLDADKVTFPKIGYGKISTSKRFGKCIAEAVTSVRNNESIVTGEGCDSYNPVLILYKTTDINRVLYRFGELVIERFTDTQLTNQSIRAMCARRSGEGKVKPGRHIGDYWPAFEQEQQESTQNSLRALFQGQDTHPPRSTLTERVNNVRRGILQILRAAKAPIADKVRDSRSLLRAVREQQDDTMQTQTQMQILIRELTLNPPPLLSQEDWIALSTKIYTHLARLLPEVVTAEKFAALEIFGAQSEKEQTNGTMPTACTVMHSGRELEYSLGTIASMKGETHLASLVLESYGGTSRRFDLQLALPFIAGINQNLKKVTPTQQAQLRNLYVAMSRPTSFLCLAANESRVEENTIEALVTKGWEIIRVF